MYLGLQGTQTKTVIAGIRGITTGIADALPVWCRKPAERGVRKLSRPVSARLLIRLQIGSDPPGQRKWDSPKR